ncbi:hypothetical protein [Paraliobacillus ryukyuensis]|uniref:hypothetical protein n=1 Tax=Paraliobacillus ryukyuensis TaxID=200904 RepID=UPI00277B4B46|nr:hypothetical protein [Paraliobacillus ryukyuensis]
MIKIVDSIMGSGKTSMSIQMMNDDDEHSYIYITPYLEEVQRVKKETKKTFYEPKVHMNDGQLLFKQDAFHELLRQNKNIVSTHSLFSRSNEETMELIYSNNYILILDEVMDVVEQVDMKEHDLESLIKLDFVKVDKDTGLITWNEDMEDKSTQYDYVKDLCRNSGLYMYKDNMFMWTFPVKVFQAFKEVYNLTYLFDAQIQKYYYDLNNMEYEYYYVIKDKDKFKLQLGKPNNKEIKDKLKQLIDVYEGKLNKIGDSEYSLSKSWYSKRKESLAVLKNNTENYFKNIVKAKSGDIIWTTFKGYKNKIKGRGYSRSFISMNIRATNQYKDRSCLAYTVNRYINPVIKGFFHSQKVDVDEDMFAISELIQWIWRSKVRDDGNINIYIPSFRMRKLFYDWLDDNIN